MIGEAGIDGIVLHSEVSIRKHWIWRLGGQDTLLEM